MGSRDGLGYSEFPEDAEVMDEAALRECTRASGVVAFRLYDIQNYSSYVALGLELGDHTQQPISTEEFRPMNLFPKYNPFRQK